MPKMKQLAGMRFGRLVVLSHIGRAKWYHPIWLCQCDCGLQHQTTTAQLLRGDTVSCGCWRTKPIPPEDRIKRSILIDENGCWNWQKKKCRGGYGSLKIQLGSRNNYRFTGAHRYSYETFVGEIGDLHVLHKCDNRACVNPEHLFLGTHQDNMRDMHAKGRGPKGYKRKPKTDASLSSGRSGSGEVSNG